jgi:hypothetical protein
MVRRDHAASFTRLEDKDMTRSTFMTLSAAISLVYGVVGLAATRQLASIYGATIDPQTELAVKFLAAAYLGYAVTNWVARHTTDPVGRRAIVLGNLTGWAASLGVGIYGTALIGATVIGIATVAVQALFTLGWGYHAFVRGGARSPTLRDATAP